MKQVDEIFKTFVLEDGRVLNFTEEQWELYIRRLYDAIRDEAISRLENEGKLKPMAKA